MRKVIKIVSLAVAACATLTLLTACGGQDQPTYTSIDDFDGKTIAVLAENNHDTDIAERLPNAHITYYEGEVDLTAAVLSGKADAFLEDDAVVKELVEEVDGLEYLDELLDYREYGFIFPKTEEGAKLCAEFNRFLATANQEGLLEELEEIWMGERHEERLPADLDSLTGENGTLIMAIDGARPPFSYIIEGEFGGYELDLAVAFCQAYGYGLEFADMEFGAMIPALYAGRCDFGASAIIYTEERAQTVLYSDCHYQTGGMFAYAAEEEGEGAIDSVLSSMRKTFLKDARWKLYTKGICVTLLISLASIIFGFAVGFGVYLAQRFSHGWIKTAINKFCSFLGWLIDGLPTVVLLMILFYIVFRNSAISGVWISILAFTLVFAATVVQLIKKSVNQVGDDQLKAAFALGYTEWQAFFRFIVPQAVQNFLPLFKASAVGLLRGTSIVGYVAVQDLTRMSDIVRSRTYEAFFPLIIAAIIYFVLAAILKLAIGLIEKRCNPRRRSKEEILKGTDEE